MKNKERILILSFININMPVIVYVLKKAKKKHTHPHTHMCTHTHTHVATRPSLMNILYSIICMSFCINGFEL